MKREKRFVSLSCALVLLLISSSAFAHNLWLNPVNQHPQVGETVDINIAWGHTFRADRTDQEVKDNIEEVSAVDPDGNTVPLEKASPSLYKLKIEKEGVYLVTARIKSGFFTMTPEGRKWGNKKDVENATKCTAFDISAKTIIVAGSEDKNLSEAANQPLELIPLANPETLKKGDSLPIKVLLQGKPLAGLAVKATYAGYEEANGGSHDEKHAGHHEGEKKGESGASDKGHGGHDKHYPVETVTDDNGQATLKLDTNGYWIVFLSHRMPYTDAEICDESMFNTAFTFEVK